MERTTSKKTEFREYMSTCPDTPATMQVKRFCESCTMKIQGRQTRWDSKKCFCKHVTFGSFSRVFCIEVQQECRPSNANPRWPHATCTPSHPLALHLLKKVQVPSRTQGKCTKPKETLEKEKKTKNVKP